MRVVGVTGTIGSGKSAVLGWLAARGARTVDADALVHRLYETDADLQRRLSERFGPDVLSAGRVDRAALRRALSTPEALADLEAIVHPAVQGARDALIEEAARQGQAGLRPGSDQAGRERRLRPLRRAVDRGGAPRGAARSPRRAGPG